MKVRFLCLLVTLSVLSLSIARVAQTSFNQPPVADAGPILVGTTLVAMTLDGSNSGDIDGTIVSYAWDFGDGSPYYEETAGSAPDGVFDGITTHVYSFGVYIARLEVTDDGGLVDTDTTMVTISNQPPVADANGPYTETIGMPIILDGSGSYDPDGTIINWEWDLDNDGQFDDASGETITLTFGSVGTHVVGIRVTDEYGESDTDEASVTIIEAAVITAHKYNDVDGDGVQDAGEPDIEGWMVELYRSEDGGSTWTKVAEGTTGSDGTVTFSSLLVPRFYKVVEEQRTNWVAITPAVVIVNAQIGGVYACEFGNAYQPTRVPEFAFAVPMLTSLVATLYLALKKRLGKKLT